MASREILTRRQAITLLLGGCATAAIVLNNQPETSNHAMEPKPASPQPVKAPSGELPKSANPVSSPITSSELSQTPSFQSPTIITEVFEPSRIPNDLGYLEKVEFPNPFTQNRMDHTYVQRLNRKAGLREIQTIFPDSIFGFSEKIKEFGLIPEVIPSNSDIHTITAYGRGYIERVLNLLEATPWARGPKLKELGVNVPDNLAIELPDGDLLDVLKQFSSDYQSKIIFEKYPKIGTNYLMAVTNYPVMSRDGVITPEARVDTNLPSFLTERENLEERGMVYYRYTNAQIAAKMLHEAMHPWQFRGAMAIVRNNPDLSDKIKDPSELAAWIRRQEHDEKIRLENFLMKNKGYALHIIDSIATNEAQANLVPQLMLAVLNEVNGKRFPGFSDDDPFPTDTDALFQVFRREVMPNGSKSADPYNREWLMKHVNW